MDLNLGGIIDGISELIHDFQVLIIGDK